jgi:hypothetical protein
MLLSNPRKTKTKRRKKMATRKKRRSSAQVAATRKLVALNKARRRVGKSVKRRVKRTATTVARAYRSARKSAGSVVRRARRSNAVRGNFGIVSLVTQAGIGAVGALAVDVVYNKLPLPANLKSGNVAPLTKAAITVGLGILGGKVVSKNLAHGATVGALTVQLHQFLKGFAGGLLPAGVAGYTDINGVGYYTPAQIADSGMGEYMSGAYEPSYGEVDQVY